MNATPAKPAQIRSTHLATVAGDALVHVFTPVNGKLRCPAAGEATRLGRRPVTEITCPACHADYPTTARR